MNILNSASESKLKSNLFKFPVAKSEPASRNSSQNKKTLKVIKRASCELNIETEDYLLENEGDIRSFLKSPKSVSSVRFNDKGKVIPYTFVGPKNLFENPETIPKITKKPTFSTPSSPNSVGFSRLMPLVRKQVTIKIDHERRFQERMNEIDEAHKKDLEMEREKLKNLNLEQKYIMSKEQRALKKYQQTARDWEKIDTALCKKVKKPREELLQSRAFEYREKLEELEVIDKAKSVDASNRYY